MPVVWWAPRQAGSARSPYPSPTSRLSTASAIVCGTILQRSGLLRDIAFSPTSSTENAAQLVAADDAVDAAYLQIERSIIDTIALQQPVAVDLRRLVALLQTGLHLERFADTGVEVARIVHAVDVAEAAWFQVTGELRQFDHDATDVVESGDLT